MEKPAILSLKVFLGPFFILLSSFGSSAADDIAADALIVTGSHIPYTVLNQPMNSYVISQDDIGPRLGLSIADLLYGVPGIDISKQGGDGGNTSLFFRGGEPNFTVFLIDGVRVNNPTNSRGGSFDLSALDPFLIERIEIVAGALSPVLGADALSGAINIITRKGSDQPITSFRVSYDSNDSFTVSSSFTGAYSAKINLSLGASVTESDDQIEGDSLSRLNLQGRLDAVVLPSLNISASLFYADMTATAFPDASGGPRLAVLRDTQRRESNHISGSLRSSLQLTDEANITLTYLAGHIDEVVEAPGIAPGLLEAVPPFVSRTKFNRHEFILDSVISLTDDLTLGVGATYLKEVGSDDGFVDFGILVPANFGLKRSTRSIFGELRYQILDVCTATASGRIDKPSSFDSETTFRAMAQCKIPSLETSIFASWAQGFKLPSFFALGNPLVGNPSLLPERSSNFEIGVRKSLKDGTLMLELSYYDNQFEELIDFDPIAFIIVNRSEIKVRGLEASLTIKPMENLQIGVRVNYSEFDVLDDQSDLRQRPKWKGSFEIDWNIASNVTLNGYGIYRGQVIDSSVPTGIIPLSGFQRFDINLSWRFRDRASLGLLVKNLTDRDYEETIGFPSTGRLARIALQHSF